MRAVSGRARRWVALAGVALALGCTFDEWMFRPLRGRSRVVGSVAGVSSQGGSSLRVTGGFEAPVRRCDQRWCVTGAVGP
jgi:hypothetical protein